MTSRNGEGPTSGDPQRWVCCQLGAREHYSIPRALAAQGVLGRLLTDVWIAPSTPWRVLPARRWRERFSPEVPSDRVKAWNGGAALFEGLSRLRRTHGWDEILERNRWFQDRVVDELTASQSHERPGVVFSYSYTAERPFAWARKHGWRTVLGQIDPGPVEERLVARLHAGSRIAAANWCPAPAEYWRAWKRECELADTIVVNSEWSRRALVEEGIPADKFEIVPLAYEAKAGNGPPERAYPAKFTNQRPLRALFLGQANLRKGLDVLIDAMRLLSSDPVEFTIVGPIGVTIPEDLTEIAKVRWVGAVPRGGAAEYYRMADVFVFPTHSDGFGLTQLEAQAWRLPLVVSRFCGEVVEHGRNGQLVDPLTGEALADALRRLLRDPARLAAMSAESRVEERFSLDALGRRLLAIADRSSPDVEAMDSPCWNR